LKSKPKRSLASVIILEDITKNSDLLFKKSIESLDVSNRSRFNKIKKLERQRQFAISKFLLKQAIQIKLAIPITLDSLPEGQPYIPEYEIFCSISHTGNSVAVAFSTYSEIGVDVEIHRKRAFTKLVKNYFHPEEYKIFSALKEPEKMDWFYAHWTKKEASAKAKGEGINSRNLGKKINLSDSLVRHKYFSIKNYSLSCVHYNKKPIELEITTPLDYAPWMNLTTRSWL
jgi:phosphopantetheine--protein transferase-like protein